MCSIAEYFLNFVWILTRPAGSSKFSAIKQTKTFNKIYVCTKWSNCLWVIHYIYCFWMRFFNQMLSHKAMGVVWFEENIWSLKHSWMFFKMRFLVLDWIARPLLVLKSGVPLSLIAKLRGHKTVITELIKRKICKEKKSASDDSERFWLFVRTPRSLLQLIVLDG